MQLVALPSWRLTNVNRLEGPPKRGRRKPDPRGSGNHLPTADLTVVGGVVGGIGAATTQQTTHITWTPEDAVAFAAQTDQLWQALNAAAVESSGVGTRGQTQSAATQLAGQELVNFIADYTAWSGFYADALNSTFTPVVLWWDTDTISDFQGKATAWYNIIQARDPQATLPVLSQGTPSSGLSLPKPSTVALFAGIGAAGLGLYFAWPWLAKARARAR